MTAGTFRLLSAKGVAVLPQTHNRFPTGTGQRMKYPQTCGALVR